MKQKIYGASSNSWASFKQSQSGSAKWEDPEFKADDDSLFWNNRQWGRIMDSSKIAGSRSIPGGRQWKRPDELAGVNDCDEVTYAATPSLWGDEGIKPMGIRQHQVGDCWMLAAAAALAEHPERVERIFWNKEYNANGAFRVYFWINSEWVGINVDDRLPLHYRQDVASYGMPAGTAGHGVPLGARASLNRAWWVPILEKAFAKAHLNYDRIIGGQMEEGMRKLSGMPTTSLPQKYKRDANLMRKALKLYTEKDYPLTSACCHQNYGGLYDGHAYTVLHYHKFSNGVELVKMRNPHSSENYTGAYRDDDPAWTAAMKSEIGGLTVANDGTFWIPYDKWLASFGELMVTFWEEFEGYKKLSAEFLPDQQITYTVTNPRTQMLFVSFDQWGARSFPRKNCWDLGWPSVLKLEDSTGAAVSDTAVGRLDSGVVGGLDGPLPAGTYNLVVTNQNAKAIPFHLNVYWKDEEGDISQKSQHII